MTPSNAHNNQKQEQSSIATATTYVGSGGLVAIVSVVGLVALVLIIACFFAVMNSKPFQQSASSEIALTQQKPKASPPEQITPAPAPLVTPTTTRTSTLPQTTVEDPDSAYWDGPWLRDYIRAEGDCDGGDFLWVVQPGTEGLYALSKQCFPHIWGSQILTRCKAMHLADGFCALWDPHSIMSDNYRLGDLEIIVLTQACLERANHSEYLEGPLHQDCVVKPG